MLIIYRFFVWNGESSMLIGLEFIDKASSCSIIVSLLLFFSFVGSVVMEKKKPHTRL